MKQHSYDRIYSMKKLFSAVTILLGWASAAWAAPPVPLTTLQAVRALSNAEVSQGLPVAFEATVTYYRDYEHTLFVQDGDVAIYVWANTDAKLFPGDHVLVYGKTHADFHPDVISDGVTLLHHGATPKPVPASFSELIQAQHDCALPTSF
jgi:hypothetical protein